MIKKLFLTILITGLSYPIIAQEIKGVITNTKQRPLKGMKVWRKNTVESITTDKLGVFVFSNISSADTLVISVSRKEEAIIPVGNLREIIIKLEKKFYLLHDGKKEYKREYQKVFRSNNSSNILTREQIAKLSVNSIYDLFKGYLPGVQVSDGVNGQQISIRGGNSFELNTEPLFIVDGVQYENSADVDAAVSVSDIEKIEVMKDGAAYGMKGSNGAIIITTAKSN